MGNGAQMIWTGKAEGVMYEPEFGTQCVVDVEALLGVMYPLCTVAGIKG